jgi:dTMP kinase
MITRENIKGKIIVFEGLDGCFKETNAKALTEYIAKNFNSNTILISFPRYGTDGCHFVTKYLKGEYGTLGEVNPYTAALCYAMDRLDNKKYIDNLLEQGYTIILDRYVGSNLLYQSTKFESYQEMDEFMDWCIDLEFNKNKLTKPDITLFMYIPVSINPNLGIERKNKDGIKNDLHESNIAFMKQVEKHHRYICDKQGWNIVKCYEFRKTVDNIYSIIYDKKTIFSNILDILNGHFN